MVGRQVESHDQPDGRECQKEYNKFGITGRVHDLGLQNTQFKPLPRKRQICRGKTITSSFENNLGLDSEPTQLRVRSHLLGWFYRP